MVTARRGVALMRRADDMDTHNKAAVAAYYGALPFSQVLFRYWWPFWLFHDASRGNMVVRAAAYRHNQSMRIYLPGYLVRWSFGSVLLLALTLMLNTGSGSAVLWMAAGSGMALASALCMLLEIGFVYLYLSRHDF
jgi:hypothetical protein